MKKVLLINGSPNKNGNTAAALYIAERVLGEKGIAAERIELGKKPVRGCIACERCDETKRCAFDDNQCNLIIEKILESDAVIIGTPVYFAAPNGALCALLDRVFYAAACKGQLFAGKPAAAIATVWREGGTAALDRINKYFTYSQMPVISGDYWNVMLDSGKDDFGKAVIERMAENMAALLLR